MEVTGPRLSEQHVQALVGEEEQERKEEEQKEWRGAGRCSWWVGGVVLFCCHHSKGGQARSVVWFPPRATRFHAFCGKKG